MIPWPEKYRRRTSSRARPPKKRESRFSIGCRSPSITTSTSNPPRKGSARTLHNACTSAAGACSRESFESSKFLLPMRSAKRRPTSDRSGLGGQGAARRAGGEAFDEAHDVLTHDAPGVDVPLDLAAVDLPPHALRSAARSGE